MPNALLKYQISEGNLTKESAHEPIVICSDCNGLSRRDVIPIKLYKDCYTARLEQKSDEEIISHIRTENSKISNPGSKYKNEISFFDKNVDPSSEFTEVLDIGGREGVIAETFRKRGASVTIVEPTEKYAKVLSRVFGFSTRATLYSAEIFDASSKDLVIALEVLHRVDDPHTFLKSAHKHLRTDGYLFLGLNTINLPALNYATQQHRLWFSPSTISILLSRNGFNLVACKEMRINGIGQMKVLAQKTNARTNSNRRLDLRWHLHTQLLRVNYGIMEPIFPQHSKIINAIYIWFRKLSGMMPKISRS